MASEAARATLKPVEVGIVYETDGGAMTAGFGPNFTQGDEKAYAQALVDWANAHGGMAGHKITPVYYDLDLTSPTPYSESLSAMCQSFTQDHRVVAALFVASQTPNDLAKCLSGKHIAYFGDGVYPEGAQDFAQIPYFMAPSDLGTQRAFKTLLNSLLTRNYFKPNDRIGVLLTSNETGSVAAYQDVVEPTFKTHAIPYETQQITFPASTPDISNSFAQTQSAELHFRTDGVTKVLFIGPGTEGTFMDYAESQRWTPGYIVTSFDQPWAIYDDGQGAPVDQLANTIGIGWEPITDIGGYSPSVAAAAENATTRLCSQIERANTAQITGNTPLWAERSFCEAVLFIKAAADAAGPNHVDGPGILDGYNRLGTSLLSTLTTYGTDVSAAQHDGVTTFRILGFNRSCPCFQYTGPVQPVQPYKGGTQ